MSDNDRKDEHMRMTVCMYVNVRVSVKLCARVCVCEYLCEAVRVVVNWCECAWKYTYALQQVAPVGCQEPGVQDENGIHVFHAIDGLQ
jgi:hypothetical protein